MDSYNNVDDVFANGGPLPAGKYNVRIVSAKNKPFSYDPNQGYLELRLQVISGPCKDMYAPVISLPLWVASQEAVELANSQLQRICWATGVGDIHDSEQLVGKIMKVTVEISSLALSQLMGDMDKVPYEYGIDTTLAAGLLLSAVQYRYNATVDRADFAQRSTHQKKKRAFQVIQGAKTGTTHGKQA
ncbi:MAG: DUF669 domain-containing protein [Acidithiobacillus sp.]|nr:DUF669 domain-containing protein [Acidithiobacillus sp.]